MAGIRTVPLSGVLVGGLLGGAAQTAFVYLFASLVGLELGDTLRFLGSLFSTNRSGIVLAGSMILLLMALVWAAPYRVAHEALAGSDWQKGAVYGLGIWLVSTVALWPALAVVHPAGVPSPGVFALGFGGVRALTTSLLAHVVYGTVLARTVGTWER